jgi:hypothetical protein
MFTFSWDGTHDIYGLPVESIGSVPPDVAIRTAGTRPQVGAVSSLLGVSQAVGALPDTPPPAINPREGPPHGCKYYDLPLNRLPVTVLAGANAVLAVTPICSVGWAGVVRYLALQTTDALNTTFQTRKNLAPVLPFTIAQGAVGVMADPTKIFIEIFPGETIDLLATNVGGVPIDMQARLIAWFWPEN